MTQFNVIYCTLATLLSLPPSGLSSDGFMQDFFKRFPHLPFGNMKSFKHLHDQGPMPVTGSLISSQDKFPFHMQSENFFNKMSRIKSSDRSSNHIDLPSTKSASKYSRTTTTTTTTISVRNQKRILFSKYPRTTAVTTSKRLNNYNKFKIVSTTPSFGKKNKLPGFGSKKIKDMQKSFYSYSDGYNSHHLLYPQDDDFHTQLMRPNLMNDNNNKYFAYDPFLQTPASRTKDEEPTVTLEKHFYYGDTTTMKTPAKYRFRKQKLKQGIVINEKAVSGEVHNVMEVEEEVTPATTLSTTTLSSSSTTATSSPPTTSTTTLPSSSVSDLPKMIISELPSKPKPKTPSKYHYRLTTPSVFPSQKLYVRAPSKGIHYSPLSYTHYNFDKFMPVPPPSLPAVPPSDVQSPKLKYTYTTITTKTPKNRSPTSSVVVMPPYTPAPNKSETTTTSTAEETTTTATTTTTTPRHDVYFIPRYSIKNFPYRPHYKPSPVNSINPDTIETDVDVGQADPEHDIDSNNTDNSHTDADPNNKKKYSYKVRGGHVQFVTGLPREHGGEPRELPDKYLYVFRDPEKSVNYGQHPPNLYDHPHQYPPRGPVFLPPLAPHHYPPYPYHVSENHVPPHHDQELPPEHKVQQYKYHSKIKYKPKEDPDKLKYKYSTPVKVLESKSKKYLPHNKIIKATFFEDQELDSQKDVEETSSSSSVEETLKKPDEEAHQDGVYFKPSQERYPRSKTPKMMDNFEENKLFKKNLQQLMDKQFKIQPTDFLSGFLPVQDQTENYLPTRRKMLTEKRKNLDYEYTRNTELNMEQKTSSVTRPATTISKVPSSKAHIDNNDLERKDDLQDNYRETDTNNDGDIDANQSRNPFKDNNLLQRILQKYKVKTSEKNGKIQHKIEREKTLSPIQSIKEKLFGRFIQFLRGKPKQKSAFSLRRESKVAKGLMKENSESKRNPKQAPEFKEENKGINDLHESQEELPTNKDSVEVMNNVDPSGEPKPQNRIPQSFLHNFGRYKSKESSPPSSQDSYRNFLKKLEKKNGRNES